MHSLRALVTVTALGLAAMTAACMSTDTLGTAASVPALPELPSHPERYAIPLTAARSAQDLGDGAVSLAECIQIALRSSPQTRMSRENARAAAAMLGNIRGQLLPQVDFTASAERRQDQVLTEVEEEYLRTLYEGRFAVRQILLDGGVRQAQIDAAKASLRGAGFGHNAVLLDVALATEVSYYRLLAAQSLLQVAEEAVRQRERHLELAERRLGVGLGRQVEVLQARAERADAELAVVDARKQVRDARGALASVMGLPVYTDLRVVDID